MRIKITIKGDRFRIDFEGISLKTLRKIENFMGSSNNIMLGISNGTIVIMDSLSFKSLKKSFIHTKYDSIYISDLGTFLLDLNEFEKEELESEEIEGGNNEDQD
jgi:hypothetical protein